MFIYLSSGSKTDKKVFFSDAIRLNLFHLKCRFRLDSCHFSENFLFKNEYLMFNVKKMFSNIFAYLYLEFLETITANDKQCISNVYTDIIVILSTKVTRKNSNYSVKVRETSYLKKIKKIP